MSGAPNESKCFGPIVWNTQYLAENVPNQKICEQTSVYRYTFLSMLHWLVYRILGTTRVEYTPMSPNFSIHFKKISQMSPKILRNIYIESVIFITQIFKSTIIDECQNCASGEIFVLYVTLFLKMHTGDSLRIIEILNWRVKKLRRRRNFYILWCLISEDAYRR